MWYLIEDFFDQSWFMKLMLGFGWLCVIIMLTSFGDMAWTKWIEPMLAG
jgi:hypothetical protein